MSRYWGLILLTVPIVLAIAVLVGRPGIIRDHPFVLALMVLLGFVIGFLLVGLRGRPPTR